MTIRNVKMLETDFKGQRTAYTSNSIFVALLCNSTSNYDPEVIGETIFPGGFGMIEPPGPSFGFGSLFLAEKEQNGKVAISALDARLNEEGEKVSKIEILESLETYFDAYFEVLEDRKVIVQIPWGKFLDRLLQESEYSYIHLIEFEPDE